MLRYYAAVQTMAVTLTAMAMRELAGLTASFHLNTDAAITGQAQQPVRIAPLRENISY